MATAALRTNVRKLRIANVVSGRFGDAPKDTGEKLIWVDESRPGAQQIVLDAPAASSFQMTVVLAKIPDNARIEACSLWNLAAFVHRNTDEKARIVETERDQTTGQMEVAVCLMLRDEPLDLPRLAQLEKVLDALDELATELQAELPAPIGKTPEIPRELRGKVASIPPFAKTDSNIGDVSTSVVQKLDAGMFVALVGEPLRLRVELGRIARSLPNLVVLREPIALQGLPELAGAVHQAGFVLATPSNLLHPRGSVYELGRESESTLCELSASPQPVLAFGSREQLESILGVGQGRTYSPLQPVIEELPSANGADLARAAFGEQLSPKACAQLIDPVLTTIQNHAAGSVETLLPPLCNMAAKLGPGNPRLPDQLESMARDLTARRDTFGQIDEAPAQPRSADLSLHLRKRLSGTGLEERMKAELFGQDAAIAQVAHRIWQEAVCRPDDEPLRLFCAGPTGCGKSQTAKILAATLGWSYQYIDAASFDSEHAVASSLAGSAPGIVNSFNDGVLARISRRPSVVEVADLDHARANVRGVLCDFFLRCLEEGTLQTGSGAVVRSIPNLLFVFTSNVAWGSGSRADSKLGFAAVTEDELRARVISHAQESLGHAFVSRVNDPVVFAPFTRATALMVAGNEIRSLLRRVCGAKHVIAERSVAERIVDTLVTTETGARGIVDATRNALCDALRKNVEIQSETVHVKLRGQEVMIESQVDECL